MRLLLPIMLALSLSITTAADAAVSMNETAASFVVSNEIISAAIDKSAGTFTLKYKATQVIDHGYWSIVQSVAGSEGALGTGGESRLRVNPAQNDGERAEVVCSFPYHGKGFPCDVEIHYAVNRNQAALYAWTVWTHKSDHPAVTIGLARAAAKLPGSVFDYIAIDEHRHGLMPSGADWDRGEQLNMKEVRRMVTGPFAGKVEHKYDYSACFADTPAYGWISTQKKIGVFMINPSIEYIAGGPTKTELSAHLDGNRGGAPTLLNVFIGPHYGGTTLPLAEGETWSKTFGPFLFYCNEGPDPESIFKEAIAKGNGERQAWPYAWALRSDSRVTVTGKLSIADPFNSKPDVHNIHVGLAAAPYTAQARPGAELIDWQRDAKHYQFWSRADDNGSFTIPHVLPGTYELYVFADGILGEFRKADVTIAAGKTVDLGELTWKPVHFGKPIWDIGIPNRSASEFRHGDDYWHWGLYNEYPEEFPDDVQFVIGKSDYRRDWNYCQPPRVEDGKVKSTTWSILFDVPESVKGKATLRLSICGFRGPDGIAVTVNDHDAGNTGPIPEDGVMHRDGIHGVLYERDVSFDASLLKPGTNRITLTPRAKAWPDGVLYDYVRLEMDDTEAK